MRKGINSGQCALVYRKWVGVDKDGAESGEGVEVRIAGEKGRKENGGREKRDAHF